MGNRDKFGEDYQAMLARLIAERCRHGLTQQDIARAMGTDQLQVSKLEQRERRLDLIDFIRYCKAIDVQPGAWLDQALGELKAGGDPDATGP